MFCYKHVQSTKVKYKCFPKSSMNDLVTITFFIKQCPVHRGIYDPLKMMEGGGLTDNVQKSF